MRSESGWKELQYLGFVMRIKGKNLNMKLFAEKGAMSLIHFNHMNWVMYPGIPENRQNVLVN